MGTDPDANRSAGLHFYRGHVLPDRYARSIAVRQTNMGRYMRPNRSTLAACLIAMASACLAQSPAAQPFVITDNKAVRTAESLFQDVQALAGLVTPCVESGKGTPVDCACRFRAQLTQVQGSARNVQAQYPEWRDKVVNWTDPTTKLSRAISVEAVVRQSSLKCAAK